MTVIPNRKTLLHSLHELGQITHLHQQFLTKIRRLITASAQ
jgi:hypothetical protein